MNITHGSPPSRTQIKQWAAEYADPTLTEKQLYHTLAHIDVSSQLILETMMLFLPLSHQKIANAYFNAHRVAPKPSHVVALDLLDSIGVLDKKCKALGAEIRYDLLPRYRRLAACIDAYLANPTPISAENVILACRGDERLTAGPTEISEMTSWLIKTAVSELELVVPEREEDEFHCRTLVG